MLGIFSSYENTMYKLPGVEVDKNKLYKIAKKYNIPFQIICGNQVTLDTVISALVRHHYNLLWFCGHGKIDGDGNSAYILPDSRSFLVPPELCIRSDALEFCLASHSSELVICVFDFCHAGNMLYLGYTYFGGEFKKTESSIHKPDKIRIAICASSLAGTTPENEAGGFLTQYLIYLLEKYHHLSLALIDGERETYNKNNFIIKTNAVFDDKVKFIKLNE